MTPPIRFVYFDLDDTLLDHRAAERNALGDVFDRLRNHFSTCTLVELQACYHRKNVELWKRYGAGEITREEVQRQRFEHILATFGVSDLDAAHVGELYMTCYSDHWCMIEGAGDAFDWIAGRVPIGILTNGFADVQYAKLARFGALRNRIHALVVSEEVGFMKPHPEIFRHAARVAGVPGENLLYVGDSLHSDVEGARGAGWQAAWYTPTSTSGETPEGVFRFARWEELVRYLEEQIPGEAKS